MAAERRQARSPRSPTALAAAGRCIPGSCCPVPALAGRRACCASGRPPLCRVARRPRRGSRRAPFSLYQTSSGGGTGRWDDGASKQSNRCGTRGLRGAGLRHRTVWLATGPPRNTTPYGRGRAVRAGGRRHRPSRRRCSASNFTLSASPGTPGRPAAVARALRPSNFGAVRWRTMPSDAAAAPQV